MEIVSKERVSKALTPSGLRCLAALPTVNLAAGCAHGCVYCYIRGYSQYPGDGAVVVYRNTAEQVRHELQRRRRRPVAVYFCPSSDPFMPIEPVLDQSYRTMRLLLQRGIGVQFVTKGAIPPRFMKLFAERPNRVSGQIGLTTLDEHLNAVLEPRAATAQRRLDDLRQLIEAGVSASLRADPLIHGVTDTDDLLDALFHAASACGVRDVSASYLFLRPAIARSIRRNVRDPRLLRRLFEPFEHARRTSIGAGEGKSLPVELRRAGLQRCQRLAERHGLKLRICGCKNAELTSSRCHLTDLSITARSHRRDDPQGRLW